MRDDKQLAMFVVKVKNVSIWRISPLYVWLELRVCEFHGKQQKWKPEQHEFPENCILQGRKHHLWKLTKAHHCISYPS